jgi:hypothetical protein
MFNRLLLSFASALTSIMTLTPSAFAQSVEIDIIGVVPEQVTVSIPNIDPTVKNSRNLTKKDKIFQAVNSSNISFNSSRPINVIISTPQLVLGKTSNRKETIRTANLKGGTGNSAIVANDVTTALGAGVTNLQLETAVQRPQGFSVENYDYATTLTVVPQ